MSLVAVVLAVIEIVAPCGLDSQRAPDSIHCPRCDGSSWVVVVSESEMHDQSIEVTDCNGRVHFHDISYHSWECKCCRCLYEFDVMWTPSPCWCGWTRDHPVPMPTCPQTDYYDPPVDARGVSVGVSAEPAWAGISSLAPAGFPEVIYGEYQAGQPGRVLTTHGRRRKAEKVRRLPAAH